VGTVPYAGCIIMELYQHPNGSFEVDLLFRRNGNLTRLELDGCAASGGEDSCPLDRLLEQYKSRAIFKEDTLYKECGLTYCVDDGADGSSASGRGED